MSYGGSGSCGKARGRAASGRRLSFAARRGRVGKLSVGGGIRARETKRLFEGAAARLGDWRDDVRAAATLAYSGDVR